MTLNNNKNLFLQILMSVIPMFVRLMLFVRIHSEASHVHVILASLAMEQSVQVKFYLKEH